MKARAVWLLLCAIWGSTWLFIKIGLADLPPLSFAGIRFVLAFVILSLIVAARGAGVPRAKADLALLAATSVLSVAVMRSAKHRSGPGQAAAPTDLF